MQTSKSNRKSHEVFLHVWHLNGTHNVIRNPRSLLLRSRVKQRLGALQRLDIEIRNVALAIGQLHANFELLVEHHIVLPQTAGAVVHAQDALLHLHLVCRAAPGHGVVLALLAPGARDCHAAFGKGQAGPRSLLGLRYLVVGSVGEVATPDVLRCADTSGMC